MRYNIGFSVVTDKPIFQVKKADFLCIVKCAALSIKMTKLRAEYV